jgi:hypothetical protein
VSCIFDKYRMCRTTSSEATARDARVRTPELLPNHKSFRKDQTDLLGGGSFTYEADTK